MLLFEFKKIRKINVPYCLDPSILLKLFVKTQMIFGFQLKV